MKKAIIFILTGFFIFPVISQSADEQRLRSAMESGCLTNGSLKRQISTGRIYYKKESVQQPGKMVKYYADMTYEFEDGSNSGKWKCPQLSQNSSNSFSSSDELIVATSILLGLSDFSSSSSNQSSSTFRHKCEWCGKKFNEGGFSIFDPGNVNKREISSGAPYGEPVGINYCTKHYCSRICVNEKLKRY